MVKDGPGSSSVFIFKPLFLHNFEANCKSLTSLETLVTFNLSPRGDRRADFRIPPTSLIVTQLPPELRGCQTLSAATGTLCAQKPETVTHPRKNTGSGRNNPPKKRLLSLIPEPNDLYFRNKSFTVFTDLKPLINNLVGCSKM